MITRYVLRADLAYDWNFSIDDLALDTLRTKKHRQRRENKLQHLIFGLKVPYYI